MTPGFKLGKTLPTLPAQRVRLRWLTDSDVLALFTIFGDPDVTRYWGHRALPDPGAAAALLREIQALFAQGRLFQWGIALLDNDVIIGTCTLAALDPENRRAELGFALGQTYWGKGYIAEILPVLIRFGFSEMGLNRLTADTDPHNARSIRVLERLGFQREGYLREHYLVQGERQDSILFGLLRADWLDLDRT